MASKSSAETNDLGEYRLYGLAPGHYLAIEAYPQWNRVGGDFGDEDTGLQGYAKLFYLHWIRRKRMVKAGEEIPFVDIPMRMVPVFTVRGHVFNQITHKPGQGTTVFMLPKARNVQWDGNIIRAGVDKPWDGSFWSCTDVVPEATKRRRCGLMRAKNIRRRSPSMSEARTSVWGRADAAAGIERAGQIVGRRPRSRRTEITIIPIMEDMNMVFAGMTHVASNGSFTIKDMGDGTYRPSIDGESKDCYIKDVEYAGASAINDGLLVVRGSDATLKITISSRGARLQGSVVDAD